MHDYTKHKSIVNHYKEKFCCFCDLFLIDPLVSNVSNSVISFPSQSLKIIKFFVINMGFYGTGYSSVSNSIFKVVKITLKFQAKFQFWSPTFWEMPISKPCVQDKSHVSGIFYTIKCLNCNTIKSKGCNLLNYPII